MGGWSRRSCGSGWHCTARAAWVAPGRGSPTAGSHGLGMLSQDLLLDSQPVQLFSAQTRNPAQLWLPKTLMRAQTPAGIRGMMNVRTFPKKRAKDRLELQGWTQERWSTVEKSPGGQEWQGWSRERRLAELGAEWAQSHLPSRASRAVVAASSCSPRGAVEAAGAAVPPQLSRLTSPTSAGVIGELEQMAAEWAGKRESLSRSCRSPCALCPSLRE